MFFKILFFYFRAYNSKHDGSKDFKFRLIKTEIVFYSCNGSKEENEVLVVKASFTEQPSCKPFLAHTRGRINANVDLKLHFVDPPKIPSPKSKGKFSAKLMSLKKSEIAEEEGELTASKKKEDIQKIDELCKRTKEELESIKNFGKIFQRKDAWIKLNELDRARYKVQAIRKVRSCYGSGENEFFWTKPEKFIFLVEP